MEKRKFLRTSMIGPVEISKESSVIRCVATDLSRGGAALLADQILESGRYQFRIANKKMEGRIIYRKDEGRAVTMPDKHVYRYGVQWSTPLESETEKQMIILKSK